MDIVLLCRLIYIKISYRQDTVEIILLRGKDNVLMISVKLRGLLGIYKTPVIILEPISLSDILRLSIHVSHLPHLATFLTEVLQDEILPAYVLIKSIFRDILNSLF